MIGMLHGGDSHPCDIGHRSSPTTVDHAGGTMFGIVDNNRNTISSGYANTYTGDIRHQGINALQHLTSHFLGESKEGASDLSDTRFMYLMGHHQTIFTDFQQLAQGLAISGNMLRGIATIEVHVKFAIGALAVAAMTG